MASNRLVCILAEIKSTTMNGHRNCFREIKLNSNTNNGEINLLIGGLKLYALLTNANGIVLIHQLFSIIFIPKCQSLSEFGCENYKLERITLNDVVITSLRYNFQKSGI